MTYRSEAELWAAIEPLLPPRGWLGRRFEDRSNPGMPDAKLSGPGATDRWYAWVELKVDHRAQPSLDGLRFQRGQCPWALNAGRNGERTALLVWAARLRKALVFDMAGVAFAKAMCHPYPETLFAGPLDGALTAIRGAPEGVRYARETTVPKG